MNKSTPKPPSSMDQPSRGTLISMGIGMGRLLRPKLANGLDDLIRLRHDGAFQGDQSPMASVPCLRGVSV